MGAAYGDKDGCGGSALNIQKWRWRRRKRSKRSVRLAFCPAWNKKRIFNTFSVAKSSKEVLLSR